MFLDFRFPSRFSLTRFHVAPLTRTRHHGFKRATQYLYNKSKRDIGETEEEGLWEEAAREENVNKTKMKNDAFAFRFSHWAF